MGWVLMDGACFKQVYFNIRKLPFKTIDFVKVCVLIEKFHKNPYFLCVFGKWCYNNPFHHLSFYFYPPNIACHEISRYRSQS